VREWTFLTNHATALLCVAQNPGLTLRQVGDYVGITERAAHRIVSDLCDEGYLVRTREGRRNRYQVRPDVSLRDPLLRNRPVGQLMAALQVDLAAAGGGTGHVQGIGAASPALAAKPTVTP
jgi:DNA-binding IclR family transcriptional regulator